jgi:hypothetical protein
VFKKSSFITSLISFFTAKGIYLPTADYDSDWTILYRTGSKWHLEFEHGLGAVPVIVDVQVEVDNLIFHAIGKQQYILIVFSITKYCSQS